MEYLTPEGLEKIKKELDYLKNIKRREIAERLRQAISFGDLTENASYREAKEAQSFMEGKIAKLEDLLRNTSVQKKEKTGWVQIGSVVLVSSNSHKEKFEIVGANEGNPIERKISYNSPLGQMLLDKPEGAFVEIDTPSGKVKYKIIKID
ncbi:MAG: transcription elongation factor GreA [Candidatus Nealsonbacteria bacterium CG_4_10_14_0_2_um_filter_38_17]|uniref:Transcription elongation factor GreA n=2 Tax=Candidatus Nealsoniibacteriota TaxID=1817911 RepID=A0A2M7UZ96_9BACT|nr:MAG: transcription elongation factor GreA [Candidatus Nealsonbacteria bacterium CG23_combo_of_CG06-09_8_20_14_all_38_19]PIZ89185.1 MAG: transcription elongation factor GreA [Candidatus Nealsonbacteria bacterium CG_4_10_14_0_2_um_filter_38_17]